MTNQELQRAIATKQRYPWTYVEVDSSGELVGCRPMMLSEFPVPVPDWPGSIDAAISLGEILQQDGLLDEYMRHLLHVTKADANTIDGLFRLVNASARQRAEAALMAILSKRVSCAA